VTTSFALYRLPFGRHATLLQQQSGSPLLVSSGGNDHPLLALNGQDGFVVAPFAVSQEQPLLLIRPDSVADIQLNADFGATVRERYSAVVLSVQRRCTISTAPLYFSLRTAYARDFNRFHASLGAGAFRKLVLSRCLELPAGADAPDGLQLFSRACQLYPRVFVALVYTPQSGLWLTATPEILLESDGQRWRTIALAGTQPASDDSEPQWSAKDQEEQRLVAAYIADCLSHLAIDVHEEGPRTVRAAHLLHLRSDFTFSLPSTAGIGHLLQELHPTPAVCGLPKAEASAFILAHEQSPRRYYSGFLGPLGRGATHLYVTLRCMEIFADGFRLYAGGGLLAESTEQQEWQETETKLDTMRRLLV